jgi:hypothetical protein
MSKTATAPPSTTYGYESSIPASGVPGWQFFSGTIMDPYEDVPELAWPNNVKVYHRMRTDAQFDALCKSVRLPLQRLNWKIKPNGARDEVVEDISQQLHLPIQGNNDEFVLRGRKRFNHNDLLRLALLAPTVYGHMAFEMEGEVDANDLRWRLKKLSPRMPQTIQKFDVARDGGLNGIVQYGTPVGAARTSTFQTGIPIPITQLAMYVWEKEGGNWAGRSMCRPLYKYWLLKDRMLRVDAIKNERFGAGIPTGTAPVGGDPSDYGKMAQSIRATENGGVGLPNGATIGIEGVKGTLPDTLASIRMYDEQMARSFLAMFMQLGQTETGSRSLGESFLDFFTDSLWAFEGWYEEITNLYVIEDIVDWNWGEDEQAPLLTAEEDEEKPLDAHVLAELVKSGALLVDADIQNWIRKRFYMPEYSGGQPLPTKPGDVIQTEPGGAPVPAKASSRSRKAKASKVQQRERIIVRQRVAAHQSGNHDQSSHGTPSTKKRKKVTKRAPTTVTTDLLTGLPKPNVPSDDMLLGVEPAPLSDGTGSVTISFARTGNPSQVHVRAGATTPAVGHREPSAVEAASRADFAKMQKAWEDATAKLVKAWKAVRTDQITSLVSDITKAAKLGDELSLATPEAPVLGEDLLIQHMTDLAAEAAQAALDEASAQGVTLPAVDMANLSDQIAGRAGAVANVMARDLANSAGRNAMLRYAVGVDPGDVGAGTQTALEGLSDAYLQDQLGGAVTAAQNMARVEVMAGGAENIKVYASELLDENTCDNCADEDETEFDSLAAAAADYPSGGYSECLGGPRCRGTVVAVYGEGE